MVNVISKRCEHEGCDTHPMYNYPGKKKGAYCVEHKLDGMEDVCNKRCQHEGCNTRPHYNLPNMKPAFCAEHKQPGMINVVSKSCAEEGCNKQPCYNFAGEKNGIFCVEHKLPAMMNVKSKKCAMQHCMTEVVTGEKYKGYCIRCFIHLFPEEKTSRNYKVKEQHVKDFIDKEFPDKNIVYDRIIQGACSKRRPDFYMDCGTHNLVIECDEEQHEDYACENKRIMQLFLDGGSIPLVIIRFNPDSYIDETGNKVASCFRNSRKVNVPVIDDKKEWEKRLEVLKSTIDRYIETVPEKEVTIEKLFYDHQVPTEPK